MAIIWKPSDRWVIGSVAVAVLGIGVGFWLLGSWLGGLFDERWMGTLTRVTVLLIGVLFAAAIVAQGVVKWREVQNSRQEQTQHEKAARRSEHDGRRALRDSIRQLIARQDRFHELHRMPHDQQVAWMTQDGRRFMEVIRDWPSDFEEYERLRSQDDFEAACRDVWPSGRDRNEAFNVIKARYRLYNHARYKLDPKERERLSLEGRRRHAEQDTDFEISKLESKVRLIRVRDDLFPTDED